MPTLDALRTSRSATANQISDAVAVDRLTELLVVRDRDDAWWRSLVLRVQELGLAIQAHETAPEVWCPASRTASTLRSAARLRDEHAALLGEVAQLRTLIDGARAEPHGYSLVLAGCTEVIAMVAGHGRRAREAAAQQF
ncbi:MAG: hypothetical protein AB7O74_11950 [Candidatus Nanopelagicales bacterium]